VSRTLYNGVTNELILNTGIAAEYSTWRGLQMALRVWLCLVQMVLIYFLLPETVHPTSRGIEWYKGGVNKEVYICQPLQQSRVVKEPSCW